MKERQAALAIVDAVLEREWQVVGIGGNLGWEAPLGATIMGTDRVVWGSLGTPERPEIRDFAVERKSEVSRLTEIGLSTGTA